VHFVEKSEFMGKFIICLRVRFIATGGNVKVMDPDITTGERQGYGQMSGVALQAEFSFVNILNRQTRDDSDAVIAFLSIDSDMFVPEFTNFRVGELAIATFGFLKAKNVWLMFDKEFSDEISAMTDRVYIPGCNLQVQRFASRGSVGNWCLLSTVEFRQQEKTRYGSLRIRHCVRTPTDFRTTILSRARKSAKLDFSPL
jgi:hypothetical protein